MTNLYFALHATMPIFLLMVLGYFLKRKGILTQRFASDLNQFVFKIALPILLFQNLATSHMKENFDIGYVGYCIFSTFGCIFLAYLLAKMISNPQEKGEFIQASYRSSASLLGMAITQNIYGQSKFAPLMLIGCVPVYNIMAVVVLDLFSKEHHESKLKVIQNILKNPLIIGCGLGMIVSYFQLPIPTIMSSFLNKVGQTATPLGLIAMGSLFEWKQMDQHRRLTLMAVFCKLIGFVGIFIPLAIWLGFRDEKLVTLLIMLGSATTVTAFVMAKSYAYSGVLTSNVVMLTTVLSSFTVALWLFILKCFMVI